MNMLWIILGAIGALVLYLIISKEGATTFGLENDQFAQIALMSMWGAIIGAAILPRKGQIKEYARNAAIWIGIILVLCAGYIFRYDLQDIGSRMTAGLIPGSPRTIASQDGRTRVVLNKADGQHFLANAIVNKTNIRFLVDTGASTIALSHEDAQAVGINIDELVYNIPFNTANGKAYSAQARVNYIAIGDIERWDMRVMVSQQGALNESLLGMSFLNSLSSFEFAQDELYLTD